MTLSERLTGVLSVLEPAMATSSEACFADPHAARVYAHYLMAMHDIVCASVPLMCAAREGLVGRGHSLASRVIPYLDEHIEEERGHDQLVLHDLQTLGYDRSWVMSQDPFENAAAMVGAQYYWVHHRDPVVLLAYPFVLEGYPTTIAWVSELEVRTALPTEAFSALRLHARLDHGHRDKLHRLLDELALPEPVSHWLTVNALQTMGHVIGVLAEAAARGRVLSVAAG